MPDPFRATPHNADGLADHPWVERDADLGVWRGLSEVVPVGMLRADPQGRCLAVNRRWCDITGLTEEQALGHGWIQVMHPDDLAPIIAIGDRPFEELVEEVFTHRVCRPDGEVTWAQSRVAPLRGLDGGPDGVLVSVSDVSEVVVSRQALADREELLATVLAHTPDVVLRLDLDRCVTYASPALADVFGWDPAEVQGRSALDFVAPADVRRVTEGLTRRIGAANAGPMVERRFVRRDGTVFWAEASSSVECGPTGEPRGIVVVLRDVSARRQAREDARRLRGVVEAMPAVMFEADLQGRVQYVSDRWVRLFGRPIEEASGFGWLQSIHPSDRGQALDVMAGAFDGGRDAECRMERPEGEVRWLRLVASPRPSVDDGEPHVVGYFADVTRRVATQHRAAVLERALDASSDIVVVMHAEGGEIQFVNDAARIDLGLVPAADGGRQVLADLLDRESLVRLLRDGLPTVAAGRAWHGDLSLHPGTARVAHLLATFTAAGDDEHGRPLVSLVARDVSDRTMAERRLTHLAAHDPLTGLGNRFALAERLDAAVEHCHRDGGAITLMFCDLDGFKEVNDTLGHESGDAVLVEVSRRLSRLVRTTDVPFRLGGDEFVVLVDGLHPAGGRALAERLVEVVGEPIHGPAGVSRVGMSIGVSAAVGSGADAAALLAEADAAMYAAKKAGRGRVVLATELAVLPEQAASRLG